MSGRSPFHPFYHTFHCILCIKINDFCLFVCSVLIEELVRATDLKFGMCVEHVVSRNKF